jgi:hypothetical protein
MTENAFTANRCIKQIAIVKEVFDAQSFSWLLLTHHPASSWRLVSIFDCAYYENIATASLMNIERIACHRVERVNAKGTYRIY